MRVAINQAGEDSHLREIDDLRVRGNREIRSDGLDLAIANENDLIGQDPAGIHVDQFPRSDRGDARVRRRFLRKGRHRQRKHCGEYEQNVLDHENPLELSKDAFLVSPPREMILRMPAEERKNKT
jgi:hypothetical protein